MDVYAKCDFCGNDYDTDNRLPFVLECSHVICTDCLKTILLGDKKCKKCQEETSYTSAIEVPIALSILRVVRLKEVGSLPSGKDKDNLGISDHSNLDPSPETTKGKVDTKYKKQQATKRLRAAKHGKKDFHSSDLSTTKKGGENSNGKSQIVLPSEKIARKADKKTQSLMEETSIGTCDYHSFPIIGYCKSCNQVVCKNCLILEHFKGNKVNMCDVVSMVAMAKSFITDCKGLLYIRLAITEFHKFRMEALRIYLNEKMSELQWQMNECKMKEFRDKRFMVLGALEYIDELMKAVHFYRVSLQKLRCTAKLSFDLREISHSIDSLQDRLYPVQLFAETFCKECPDFSYNVLLNHSSPEEKQKLLEVITFIAHSFEPNDFTRHTDLENNLASVMEASPNLKPISSALPSEFASTKSEIHLTTAYKVVLKYKKDIMEKLALMPGEIIIEYGRNIWIGDHTTVQGNQSSGIPSSTASHIEKNGKSRQESGHPTGARPKSLPGKSLTKSNYQGIQSQEATLSLKQENIVDESKCSNTSDSYMKNKMIKKGQKDSHTTTHHSTDSAKKASKCPMSTLSKQEVDYFLALITILTPSLAYIVATTPVNLPPIDPKKVKLFGYYSLGKLAESVKSDTEIDINSFNEQKFLHERRLKCHEEVKLFRSCLNPFATFNNDFFYYSAQKPSSLENKKSDDKVLIKSCPSQREHEAGQGEIEGSQGKNEDTPKEPRGNVIKPETHQWELEENPSNSESSQRKNDENQRERGANENAHEKNDTENEEIQKRRKANHKKHELSQREQKVSQRENEASHGEEHESQREHKPSQIQHEASHREIEKSHREIETSHREIETSPRDIETSPRDIETSPRDIETSPRDIETSPRDIETSPRDIETSPGETETSPGETETSSGETETSPGETETSQIKSEATQRELKANQRENEASQREPVAMQMEHDIGRREHEASQREHEASQREHEASQREHEASQREHEASQREHEASQREHEASQREHEASQREHEASQREHEASQREQEASQREQEASQREQEASQSEHEVSQREVESNQGEQDLSQGEPGSSRREHEASQREHEARQREHEARQREHEARQREHEARQRGHEARQREHEARQREHEARQREHEARQRKYEESLRAYEKSLGAYEESLGAYEESKGVYEDSKVVYEGNQSKYEEIPKEYELFRRLHEARRKEHIASQRLLVTINREWDAIQVKYKASLREQEGTQGEHEAMRRGHEAMRRGHEAMRRGHEAMRRGHEAMQRGHEAMQRGHEAMQRGHEAMQRGHEAMQRGHEAMQRGHEAMQRGHEAMQRGHEARQRGHEARQREHEAKQRIYEESLRAYEESLGVYEQSQSKNEKNQKEFELFRSNEARQREHISSQRELVTIHMECDATQVKYKADPMFIQRNSAKTTHGNETQTIATEETSNLTGTLVFGLMPSGSMGAVALSLNTSREILPEEVTYQSLTQTNSDEMVMLETDPLATNQSELQSDTNVPSQNSTMDEPHFETQDNFTVSGPPESSSMPTIQTPTAALPRISNPKTSGSRSQNRAKKQGKGGSVLQTQSTKTTGITVFKNSLSSAQQFCTEHKIDASYIPFVTNIFTKSIPDAKETALYIVKYMKKNRIPPIHSATLLTHENLFGIDGSESTSSDDED